MRGSGWSAAPVRRRSPSTGRSVRGQGGTRSHPAGQRPGVHGPGRPEVAQAHRGEDAVHRARQSLGEWLQRGLRQQAPRRVARHGNLLHAEGDESADREMETTRQPGQTAQLIGLQAAGTRDTDRRKARCIDPVNLENVLRRIKPDRGNYVHRTAPFLAAHKQQPHFGTSRCRWWEPPTASQADLRTRLERRKGRLQVYVRSQCQ